MRIAVVGLQGVGPALATQYALRGAEVVACDLDSERVEHLIEHGPGDAEPDLAARVRLAVGRGALRWSADVSGSVAAADVVTLFESVQPGPTGTPDATRLDRSVQAIARGLVAGQLVLVESVVGPGETRQRILPCLTSVSGLRPGHDFHLAAATQRGRCGHGIADLSRYLKYVSGLTPECTQKAVRFYGPVIDTLTVPLASLEMVEWCQIAWRVALLCNQSLGNALAGCAAQLGLDPHQGTFVANTNADFPILSASLNPLPPDVLAAAQLLQVAQELPWLEHAQRLLERTGEEVQQWLRERVGSLAGLPVLMLAADHHEEGNHPLARSLAAEGAVLTWLRRDPAAFTGPAPRVIVVCDPGLSLSELPAAALEGCEVVVDCENALSRRRVERLGAHYLGAHRP